MTMVEKEKQSKKMKRERREREKYLLESSNEDLKKKRLNLNAL